MCGVPSRSHALPADAHTLRSSGDPAPRGRHRAFAHRRDCSAITAESGLCIKDSTYEAGRVADVLTFGAGEVLKDDGQIFSCDLTPHGKKRRVYTQRDPLLGVIRDHAVQSPDESGRAQDRAVGGHQQPDRGEAVGEGAAVVLPVRGHPVRSRPAAADAASTHRRPEGDRRRADHEPGDRPDHVHRRCVDRQVDRVADGLPPCGARTRRKRSDHRDGRCRSRRSEHARGVGRKELGPALHRDQADARARVGDRFTELVVEKRVRGRTAIRPIRRSTWAR